MTVDEIEPEVPYGACESVERAAHVTPAREDHRGVADGSLYNSPTYFATFMTSPVT